MNILIFLIAFAIFIYLLTLALRLKTWVRSMRHDIYNIRDELSTFKRSNEKANAKILTAASNIAAESVNASCINSLGFEFPVFMGGPSIDTHHARNLLFLLQERKPQAILELGSGSSTIIIARALQLMGASPNRHISVDHEERFLNNTKELARLNSVDELIQFEYCPLQPEDGFPHPWYSRIPALAGSLKFDFVLIDGPPAYEDGLGRTREPALTVLRPYLADNAVIILDDANRVGEQNVVKAWQEKYPEFSLYHATEGKGVAIFTLGA
ncbi:MAG: class I SAM-dependent methyltransferase [Gammaproteobacteria bacterium]|nr:class I SAM-dependent methyltransferase [Gammaproteobacteria bacterium]MBQ0838668.1 class I SAM-dependent methyltransferase [Gammaproteobacteria bacterium]